MNDLTKQTYKLMAKSIGSLIAIKNLMANDILMSCPFPEGTPVTLWGGGLVSENTFRVADVVVKHVSLTDDAEFSYLFTHDNGTPFVNRPYSEITLREK